MNKTVKTLALIFLSNCLLIGVACATGLSGGEQYSAQSIEGRLTVQCFGGSPGPSYGTANCRSQILNPGEYSYFVGTKIDADHVSLKASREDGSFSKTKTEEYDSEKGKSKKSFNLWIATVFQRPLLGFGKNTVHYVLSKNGNTVEQGDFIVNVVDGGSAVCQRAGLYTSQTSNDCSMPQNLCPRYFSENNYCQ
ncbi:MAG: hypothetical protein Q7U04_13505 [Bacteriovorax sp.]|nr:hypothetical protein [Bacteriovorax sp.]